MRDTGNRVPNCLLIDARRARRLTQHQLAEAVHAAHQRLFGTEAAIDADHVSKLERGLITWPNTRYRAALREVLDVRTDAELGFYHRRSTATVEAGANGREVSRVRRVEFIRLLTGMGAGAGLSVAGLGAALPDPVREVLALSAEPTDPPARVGHTDIDQVRFATEMYRDWHGRYGGAACRDALLGQVRWAAGLLQGHAEDPIRRELHSAVGALADMAGWNNVDAGYHDSALRCFRLGLHCAGEAQDWTLRAELLTDMSRQAVDLGEFDEAMSLIELAQVRADRVTGTGRAMMRSNHARVLGAAGQVTECRAAIATAEDYFAHHQPADESVGSSFFQRASTTNFTLDNGSALFFAGLRDPSIVPDATRHLSTVLTQPGSVSTRRRAMSTMKIATLHLLHGDRDEGLTLADRALDDAHGVRSARLVEDLRRLRTATTGHTGPETAALRHRLDTTLPTGWNTRPPE